jgi:carbon storage regulator
MLVLTRKRNQRVLIVDGIEVWVLETRRDKVQLGFTGPPEVPIHREEVHQRIETDARKRIYARVR